MSDPRKENPLVLPNYPYLGAFSREQVGEALDRKDRIVELLLDPVGPDGTLINIPVDMLHILAFHLAYAGCDTHTDDRQLIESRTVRDPAAMFEVAEWRPRGTFDTEPEDDTAAAEAAALAATMRKQLTPQVRAALTALLVSEHNTHERGTT